jgi:hypothetical protein
VFVVLIAALAAQFLLDWSLRLRLDMRAALAGMILAGALWVTWRQVIRPLRLRFGPAEMAAAVEKRFPELNSLLVSAVDFAGGRVGAAESNSPALVQAVIANASRAAQRVEFDAVVNRQPIRRAVRGMSLLLLVVAMPFAFAPRTMAVWLERNILLRSVEWPKRTHIVVEAPDDRIVRGAFGDDLEIRANIAEGYVVPRGVEIVYETRSGKTGRETLTGVGERGFRARFPRVREEFRFYLVGGDDSTEWFDTALRERPRIESATLTIVPPAYTRLDTVTLPEGQRAVEVYKGSKLTIAARSSKPLAQASLVSGTEVVVDLPAAGAEFSATVEPAAAVTYHFDLLDQDGLRDDRPVRFSVRLLEDAAPKVRLQLPGVGNIVTLAAMLPLEAEFADPLGLAEAAVMFQGTGGSVEPKPVALAGFTPYAKVFDVKQAWPVADSGIAVGEQISIFAQARDFDDVSGPNVGQSTTITFRLVTPEELLAEFGRREQEYRRQFERLVESQERLRGELVTALGRMNEPHAAHDWELLLAPLERQERQITAQVNVIRQQFEQVLGELVINRLDSPEIHDRLGKAIIAPLTELGTRDMADAADQIRQLARDRNAELARTADPLHARILASMHEVLENMVKFEGFQETITMLRELIRLQRELQNETRGELERQGGNLFEDKPEGGGP